ncbi:MAG: gliding motility-associated C-terminal domain-containing protein, partial [Chitinophagaceae bacterium]
TIGNLPLSSPHKQNIRLFPRQKDFYYALGEETSSPNQSNLIHLLLDTSFNITSAKKIKGLLWAVPWKQFYLSRTGLIAFVGHDDPQAMNYKTDHFAVVDSAGNNVISKKVGDNLFTRADLYPVIINPDEKSISLSVGNYPALDSLKRINIPLFGDTTLYSCLGKDTSFFTIEPVSFQKTDLNPGTIYSNVIESSLMPVLSSDFVMQKQEFCKVKSVCSTIKISGDSDFCKQTQQVFIARKNQECLKNITWRTDNIPADFVTKTDSSITIRIDNAWSGYLIAEINGCGLKDSLHIEAHDPLQAFSLGGEKILCPGDSVLLTAPQGYNNYEWNTGEDSNQIYAHHTGTYSVNVTDQCGNTFSSEIVVRKPLYTLPFLKDEQVCQGDSLFIFLSSHLSSYSWNPAASPLNDSSFFIIPRENTLYTVSARDQDGCESTSNFNVVMQNCTNQVWVPNAFTPNRDGRNDSFGAYIDGRWQSFSLQVYNRWGQLVFNADEPLKQWDGKLNGSDCATGVYIWICKYRLLHANTQTKKGTVVLIR